METDKDYYKVLEIPRNASDKDIRTAYKRLAMKWHPDKNPDRLDIAERYFKRISEAYKTLSDPRKRKDHDQFSNDRPASDSKGGTKTSETTSSSHRSCHTDFHGRREFDHVSAKLDKIRTINSQLLEQANLKLKRQRNRATESTSHQRRSHHMFVGDILPEVDDDEYEKLVLNKLRAMGTNK